MRRRWGLKTTARGIFSTGSYYSGYCTLADGGGRILCYHGISSESAGPFVVTTRDFEQQMRYLAEKCTVLSVDELAELMRASDPIPPRSVSVTIDDGYLGVYTNAYPILKDYAIPATVFSTRPP